MVRVLACCGWKFCGACLGCRCCPCRFGTVRGCCPDRVAAASACAGWKYARGIGSGLRWLLVRVLWFALYSVRLLWSPTWGGRGRCRRWAALIASADFAAVGRRPALLWLRSVCSYLARGFLVHCGGCSGFGRSCAVSASCGACSADLVALPVLRLCFRSAAAVQLSPLRWRCSASTSRAAVLRFCLAARGRWRSPWALLPVVLCCYYGALGWLLGRCGNLRRVSRLLCLHGCRLCRRCFGCRRDDLRGGRCSCCGRLGRIGGDFGRRFLAISGAFQTCAFKQIASLFF